MPIVQITTGVTLDEYHREQELLAEAGDGAFPGRLLQVCYGDDDDLQILTVYASLDARDAFREEVLNPILESLGIEEEEEGLAARGFTNQIAPLHKLVVDTSQYEAVAR